MVLRVVVCFLLLVSSTWARSNTVDDDGSRRTSTHISDYVDILLNIFAILTAPNSSLPKDGGHEYFVDVLRLEFITMATGERFIVPPPTDETLERRQREAVFAANVLWMTLRFTEKVDSILNNALREAVAQHWPAGKWLTMSTLQATLETFIHLLDDAFKDDLELFIKYADVRKNYKLVNPHTPAHKVYFPFDDLAKVRVNVSMVDAWLSESGVREGIVHWQFTEIGRRDERNRAWVRSFFEFAGEAPSLILNIYGAAVKKTAEEDLRNADFPGGVMRNLLYRIAKALERAFVVERGTNEAI